MGKKVSSQCSWETILHDTQAHGCRVAWLPEEFTLQITGLLPGPEWFLCVNSFWFLLLPHHSDASLCDFYVAFVRLFV